MDDPLYEYFPEWKDTMVADTGEDGGIYIRAAKRPIQIRDCFSMAMGIGYGGEDYTHQMMESCRNGGRLYSAPGYLCDVPGAGKV